MNPKGEKAVANAIQCPKCGGEMVTSWQPGFSYKCPALGCGGVTLTRYGDYAFCGDCEEPIKKTALSEGLCFICRRQQDAEETGDGDYGDARPAPDAASAENATEGASGNVSSSRATPATVESRTAAREAVDAQGSPPKTRGTT